MIDCEVGLTGNKQQETGNKSFILVHSIIFIHNKINVFSSSSFASFIPTFIFGELFYNSFCPETKLQSGH